MATFLPGLVSDFKLIFFKISGFSSGLGSSFCFEVGISSFGFESLAAAGIGSVAVKKKLF